MRGYVLTIDPPDGLRRRSIASELADMPFGWEFVDGYRKGDPILDALYSPAKNLLLSKRSLSPGEIACYAGHRLIWQTIVERQDPHAIVFEDDAQITDRAAFDRAVQDVTSAPFDIVKLWDIKPKPVIARRRLGDTQIVVHKMIASGTGCYLISRDAAAKMLRRRSVFRAVDEDFSHAWEFGAQVWSVWPNPVTDIAAGSTIEAERISADRRRLRSLWGEALQVVKRLRHRSHLLKAQ
ncbi:MAG: glycosyltransferase family 25 protein [Mesorhizobium sp.]|nr:glycosyltransferase family 25 protein [Mesorhizobium sp.]MBL8580124.1 glycosyltransferase family 25 protein [Mesorhizobium sp.]